MKCLTVSVTPLNALSLFSLPCIYRVRTALLACSCECSVQFVMCGCAILINVAMSITVAGSLSKCRVCQMKDGGDCDCRAVIRQCEAEERREHSHITRHHTGDRSTQHSTTQRIAVQHGAVQCNTFIDGSSHCTVIVSEFRPSVLLLT